MISVRRLTRHFGGLTALKDIDLDVGEREIVGIIGPNGAGKTTFFNVLTGVLPCTSGEILFDGRAIHRLKPHQIARLGIGRTFQLVRPFSELTVLQNVLTAIGAPYCAHPLRVFGQYNQQRHRSRALHLLDITGLARHADEIARNLPLGMLRRLEIARALGLNPRVILLDESFSGLSHKEISSLAELVARLPDRDMAVVLIEHNVQITMRLCDRLVVFAHGRKIAEGRPDDVRVNPLVISAYLGGSGA